VLPQDARLENHHRLAPGGPPRGAQHESGCWSALWRRSAPGARIPALLHGGRADGRLSGSGANWRFCAASAEVRNSSRVAPGS
jgi:hypothetical protein